MMKHPYKQLTELLSLSTMTLSTTGLTGEPHAAPVYFAANETLWLYFFSDPDSRHSQDTGRDRRAAAAIYPECRDWRDLRGLQLRGGVRSVEPGAEWEAAWDIYQAKFPFVGELKAIVARNTFYVFEAYWIRLVDNRKGFGFKEEWVVKAERAE